MAQKSVLLVGASRGLGLGLAEAFKADGWEVTATVRDASKTILPAGVAVETVDIDHEDQVAALHARLATPFDMIFVVAGVGTGYEPIQETSRADAARVFNTNAVSPIRFAETFLDRIAPKGHFVFMTSRMGSIGNNEMGRADAYRASKAALNMLTKSFEVRHRDKRLTLTLMHPGWVQTDMGGAGAPLTVAESVSGMLEVLTAREGAGNLAFVDYEGTALPW